MTRTQAGWGVSGHVAGLLIGALAMWLFLPTRVTEPQIIYRDVPGETVEVVKEVPGPERIVLREHEPTWSPHVCVLGTWLD